MRIHDDTGQVVAIFYSAKRKGDKLIIDGKVMDAFRMDMIFTPREILSGLRLAFSWPVVSFMLLLPCFGLRHLLRRSKSEAGPPV